MKLHTEIFTYLRKLSNINIHKLNSLDCNLIVKNFKIVDIFYGTVLNKLLVIFNEVFVIGAYTYTVFELCLFIAVGSYTYTRSILSLL